MNKVDSINFNSSDFEPLVEAETSHFWFVERNALILNFIARHMTDSATFVEVGCGTGNVINAAAFTFPGLTTIGLEFYSEGLNFARQRNPGGHFVRGDARSLPFTGSVNIAGCFDVLEHIREDSNVLSQIQNALTDNGILLITVPQHRWLWSATDEAAGHVRRYTKAEIHQKVLDAGFLIERSTSFVSLLLPIMALSRLFAPRNKGSHDTYREFAIPKILNICFGLILRLERFAITKGLNFPIGGTRLIVGKKIKLAQ